MIVFTSAFLALLAAPALGDAAHYAMQLSTTMQRNCDETITQQIVFDGSGGQTGAPRTSHNTRSFRAQREGDGYLFIQGAVTPDGKHIELRAHVSSSGQVSNPVMSGDAVDAARAQNPNIDFATLAAASARDIPERLIVGRTFAQGDEYYPPDVSREVVDGLTRSLGFPFPLTANIHLPLGGESAEDGGRVLTWEGDMTLSGSGQTNGSQLGVNVLFHYVAVHDEATGLIRRTTSHSVIVFTQDGQRAREVHRDDDYVCRITPQ
jgi:hypothetical protein